MAIPRRFLQMSKLGRPDVDLRLNKETDEVTMDWSDVRLQMSSFDKVFLVSLPRILSNEITTHVM